MGDVHVWKGSGGEEWVVNCGHGGWDAEDADADRSCENSPSIAKPN